MSDMGCIFNLTHASLNVVSTRTLFIKVDEETEPIEVPICHSCRNHLRSLVDTTPRDSDDKTVGTQETTDPYPLLTHINNCDHC